MYLTLHTIKWRTSGVSTPNQDAVINFSRLTSGVRSILTVDSSKPSPPPPLLLLRPPLPSLATTPTRLKSLGISRSATCSLGSFDRCFLPVYEVGICMQSRSSVTLNHRTPLEISNPNVPVIQTSPDVVVKKKQEHVRGSIFFGHISEKILSSFFAYTATQEAMSSPDWPVLRSSARGFLQAIDRPRQLGIGGEG